MKEDDIQKVALAFRATILSIPVNQRPYGLKNFPSGACGDTALLLGTYFNDLGESGFSYVSGCRGSYETHTWHTHAWLQRDSLVIDLTCDQFDDAPDGFIFQTSNWHKQFREVEFSDASLVSWHGHSVNELQQFYSLIKAKL